MVGRTLLAVSMRLVAVMALVPVTASLAGGCSAAGGDPARKPGGDATCPAFCNRLCQALAVCGITDGAACATECSSGLGDQSCSDARPPDQWTCAELKGFYDCALYCGAFCTRVPQCGTFDQGLCVQGCSSAAGAGVLRCNPASVDARTCDQLKPEARWYENLGRGQDTLVPGSNGQSGLCSRADDCNMPLGCRPATTACGSCDTNADCKRLSSTPYACSAGQCQQVDCLEDTDCLRSSSGIGLVTCDVAKHVCVGCLTNANCGALKPICRDQTCIECTRDVDCATNVLSTKCDVARNTCVECLSNLDCNTAFPYCKAGACRSMP